MFVQDPYINIKAITSVIIDHCTDVALKDPRIKLLATKLAFKRGQMVLLMSWHWFPSINVIRVVTLWA